MILTRDEALRRLREKLPELHQEYGAVRIGIFGSVAKNAATEDSDVDLVVEFDRPIGLKFYRLADVLEKILGKKTEVLTQDGITTIRNSQIRQAIQESIIYV